MRSALVLSALVVCGCGDSEQTSGGGSSGGGAPSGGASSTGGAWPTGGASSGGASQGGTSSGGGAAGSGGAGAAGGGSGGGAGNPSFTPDGCFKWKNQVELQSAVNQHACVEVQAGTYTLAAPVALKPGHTLRGVSAAESIIKADQSQWKFGCCDSQITDTLPASPETSPFRVKNLTLDGAGVATYNVCCRGYVVEGSVLRRSRCSAIGAAGKGVTAKNNQMLDSAQPTDVPGKGKISCATGNFGGVAEGAAIYSEGAAEDYGTVIDGNTIQGSFGPALDINGAWGGVFKNNVVSDNTAWAAVSLYGASNWLVENNQVSHPANQPPQPYHPYCAAGPSGGHSAGIFLCQDTDAGNLVVNGNVIRGNKTSSYYGILSVGADELKPYFAPRNNTFQNNDVFGSVVGCADDFKPGQWMTDANAWTGNNCAGTPGTGPTYF